LGNTMFVANDVALNQSQPWFVPASAINALRREAIEQLEQARLAGWVRPQRKAAVEPPVEYPEKTLSYLANVYNQLAWQFYRKHGVEVIDAAYEAHQEEGEVSLMITKHCLRFSYNLCPKQAKGVKGVMGQVRAEPMTLKSGNETYTLKFDNVRNKAAIMADIERLETWVKYKNGLCSDCMGSCCSMPVEVRLPDLVRMGVVDEFELEEPVKNIAKRLEKQRVIQHFNFKHGIFTLARRANGDCQYLDQQTRLCTIYERRPNTCRNHPKIGPKPGFCAYTRNPKAARPVQPVKLSG
uniref:Peptidase U32 collagenase domain-containing protein n=1 Tax=Anopheles coluzzii TaxID=1518534 RepID=A0A8W7P8Q0_ANOCL